jgi:hypothetical protein
MKEYDYELHETRLP